MNVNEMFIDTLKGYFEKLGFFAKVTPLPEQQFGTLALRISIEKEKFGYTCDYGVSAQTIYYDADNTAGEVAYSIARAFELRKDLKDAEIAYFAMLPFGRRVFTTMCLERHIDLEIGEYNKENKEIAEYLAAQGLAFPLPQLYPQEITLTPTNKAMYFYDTLKEKKYES